MFLGIIFFLFITFVVLLAMYLTSVGDLVNGSSNAAVYSPGTEHSEYTAGCGSLGVRLAGNPIYA
jgi:hypothetical protein